MSPEHKNHTQNNNIGASPGTSKTSKLVGLFLSVALVVNLGCSPFQDEEDDDDDINFFRGGSGYSSKSGIKSSSGVTQGSSVAKGGIGSGGGSSS
jgi:hypothetical protein